jgi:hypothetical protein
MPDAYAHFHTALGQQAWINMRAHVARKTVLCRVGFPQAAAYEFPAMALVSTSGRLAQGAEPAKLALGRLDR